MSTSRGKPRPKAYLSIGEYLRKAGAFKTVNVYYNDIVSTHPSVALSRNGDDEDVDELAQGMIDAAQHGHLETLRFLAGKAQAGGEEGRVGTCIGERVACLMLHLAAENGHDAIVHYLVEDLWVDPDEATVRSMTALHYAAKANRTAVVRELSRLGADLEAKNDAGQVPAQMTKDRLLRRLFQQYLGGGAWGGAVPLIDRFVPPSASRVVDYVAVMTVKLSPQLMAESDELSDVKQATVSEIWRYPVEDHEDTPMTDASNLAEICTQTCEGESGPLAPYGTLLTDTSGARSYVWSKVLGVYQDAAQRGRARVCTVLTPPTETNSVPAGEMSVRIVLVLARHPYTSAYASICEHVGDLIVEESSKWGSLMEWPLDMENERNAQIRSCLMHYATDLPLPLPSRRAEHQVLDRVLTYGDAHASHSSFPHIEESDLRCLTSRLGPDTILTALSCLLQEQSVLLLSDNVEDLAPATSALLGLLFPLRWPHTLIPVLPTPLLHYLEAPVPFLMGMHQRGLDRVGADLSCVTMVNLTTNKVVLPIRPITSVSTVPAVDAMGNEPQRRPSRRDSGSRSLAELPRALKRRAETRLRRCVPLDMSPLSDRRHQQPRASRLYTPGLRVAVADIMVDLFGAYQTYRYVEGAQKRMVSEAPEDHRKLLETLFSTQLWRIFRDDLLAEEGGGGVNGESWEEQAQLFCACVERARHRGGAAASPAVTAGAAAAAGSNSCQDVLYPSENVEEQLSLLSVYPEPDATIESEDEGDGNDSALAAHPEGGSSSSPVRKAEAALAGSAEGFQATRGDGGGGEALTGELSLQEKTDEVLRSITTSFASVTDIFGGRSNSTTPPRVAGAGSERDGGGGSGAGAGGWDLFKPPSMTEMKRRLEGMKATGDSLSPPRVPSQPAAGSGGGGGRGAVTTPPRKNQAGGGGAGGLALFGESWRDLRRRSKDAVNEAVTKLKTALDDSDDDEVGSVNGNGNGRGSAARNAADSRVRAAAARARGGSGVEDDAFWKPFGGSGGDDEGAGGVGAGDEPVPLPTADEVRRARSEESDGLKPGPTSARADLEAYYGGGSRGGGNGGR